MPKEPLLERAILWHCGAGLIYFTPIGMILKETSNCPEYLLDSFPVPLGDNIRIFNVKLIKSEDYRGYIASKKRLLAANFSSHSLSPCHRLACLAAHYAIAPSRAEASPGVAVRVHEVCRKAIAWGRAHDRGQIQQSRITSNLGY